MFSIVFPMDTNRLEQFKETKQAYDAMPQKKEFVIPTRSYDAVHKYLTKHKLLKNVTLIPYEWSDGFNPAMGLNIGVRHAKYDHIIITSPEVKPYDNVLDELEKLVGTNVICQVFDQDDAGNLTSLVHSSYRSKDPSMYFLALFNKSDIEQINGWDEEFMRGYAYEDNDFGERWNRAGLPFIVRDDIQAVHQYHPRGETIPNGTETNRLTFETNRNNGVVYCKNGLNKL